MFLWKRLLYCFPQKLHIFMVLWKNFAYFFFSRSLFSTEQSYCICSVENHCPFFSTEMPEFISSVEKYILSFSTESLFSAQSVEKTPTISRRSFKSLIYSFRSLRQSLLPVVFRGVLRSAFRRQVSGRSAFQEVRRPAYPVAPRRN